LARGDGLGEDDDMTRYGRPAGPAGLALALGLATSGCVTAQPSCGPTADWLFTNGRVHTMNAAGTVADSVRVLGGRIEAVGDGLAAGSCTTTVDLKGRTVIPGIIDNHNHIVVLGLRPGHDTRLENARSIREVLDTITARAEGVPAGAWITAIGGFDIRQFTPAPEEPRFPSRAELDAAAPDHPVLVVQGFAGPSVTNSLARDFFAARGVAVAEDGTIAGGFPPNATSEALHALRDIDTDEDKENGLLEALDYGLSVGITTHLDQGGFPATNTSADGAASMDPYAAYDSALSLNAQGRLPARIRINFLFMETDPGTPLLRARLDNAFPELGDGMLATVGIGEFTAGASPIITEWTGALQGGSLAVAEAGWRNENHSLTPTDYKAIIDGWTAVNAAMEPPGITELGWVVAHAPFIDEEYTAKLKALGGGVSVLGGWRWLSGTAQQNGPPFRMLVDSGIPVGMSSDGMQISTMNPWIGLYYAVTGKNARGEPINAGQTIGREEALGLYTAANAWFLQEDGLGTIEPGSYADLVVLSADYFDPTAVPDEAIPDVRSVLTVVDGEIVHGAPEGL
jgi:hypothetical protein